ncbi:hypothetical protein JG688_00009344 [Phytophthora aleatoria]|uniref:Uncharacterized protein n=1 Tax=Phytophthora aleatoria TaxID=2496075 RepID=A0A8J5MFZ2_9STRA|nr:hypothetical protein JG688_00009344 [Phytophthora aleatoria]
MVIVDLTSASGDLEEELQEEYMKANQQHKNNKKNTKRNEIHRPEKSRTSHSTALLIATSNTYLKKKRSR